MPDGLLQVLHACNCQFSVVDWTLYQPKEAIMPSLSDAAKPGQHEVFDVFRVEKPAGLRWCTATPAMETAMARARDLANSDGHDYLVIHYQTGDQTVIKPDAEPC